MIWPTEKLQEAADKCKIRSEFKLRFPSAYVIARRRGILDQLFEHHPNKGRTTKRGYFDYYKNKQHCVDAANHCTTSSEFKRKFKGAYNACVKFGWLAKLTSHFYHPGNRLNRCVYIIKHPKEKIVYVGLSYFPENRFKAHSKFGIASVINLIANGGKLTILTKPLPATDAITKERQVIMKFKRYGFIILNQSVGGELGGSTRKNTIEMCRKAADECKYRGEFQRKYAGLYISARRNGWLEEIFKNHKNCGNLNAYRTIEKLQHLADKCTTRREFRLRYTSADTWCHRRKLHDHLFRNHKNLGYIKLAYMPKTNA